MVTPPPRVTIHMVASLDGFIARKDGRVDWLETSDTFEPGEVLTPLFGTRSGTARSAGCGASAPAGADRGSPGDDGLF